MDQKEVEKIWKNAVDSVCEWMVQNWANHGYLDDDDNWPTWVEKIKRSVKAPNPYYNKERQ